MSIELTENDWTLHLVARLCEEAKVCLHDPETNRVEIHSATWDVHRGLVVTDRAGNKWRLNVHATPFQLPVYGVQNDECPRCHKGHHACTPHQGPKGEHDHIECKNCGYEWLEPMA